MVSLIEKIVSRLQSNWTKNEGAMNNIVISSRIRIARNIADFKMPIIQDEHAGALVLEKVKKAAEKHGLPIGELMFQVMSEISLMDRQVLLEKHLVSPEHIDGRKNRGLLINENESVSIMINEEDHLRIQVLFPGLQLKEAWDLVNSVDNFLEEGLDYAYSEKLGYLTACPTNVGTGLRASVMLHLPALTMTKQASRIFKTLGQLGLVVRGLYGEGSESAGYIYQVSNQVTLGQKETDIIQNLTNVIYQIIEKEKETRKLLLENSRIQLEDKVGRAYGILCNAAILSSKEALNLLSDVRLGVELDLLDIDLSSDIFAEMIILTQPGYIQKQAKRSMEAIERDIARARLFKESLMTRRK